ncbi:zinc-binding loop region of homing endonuclease-domain-containing protein [Daldinia loculata]|nr:zinc-binding loop region of homing endonuclease-domain-containing protein [Daldinia loculata]KAI2778475.1 zinc-binding loop region of homing endonuclease-domain-containing protein [Daldinia loculata]
MPLDLVDRVAQAWAVGQDYRGQQRSNQNLPPKVEILSHNDLAFPHPLNHLTNGMCHAMRFPKLRQGREDPGEHNPAEHPRVQLEFTNAVTGAKTSAKIYAYHIAAVHRVNYGLETTLMNKQLLAAVCQKKAADGSPQYTIRHACGNGWCINADHLEVGRKTLNDEETSCHRALQSAEDKEEMEGAALYACKHEPKCWALKYRHPYHEKITWTVKQIGSGGHEASEAFRRA